MVMGIGPSQLIQVGTDTHWQGAPLPRDAHYRISSYFGEFPSWRNFPHTGTDIACYVHTPLSVVASGEVVNVYMNTGSVGYGVRVAHPAGEILPFPCVTTYYHMEDEPEVGIGQRLVRGQFIGFSGNTGFSTGPHLHFGLNEQDPEADEGSKDMWDFDDPLDNLIWWEEDQLEPEPEPAGWQHPSGFTKKMAGQLWLAVDPKTRQLALNHPVIRNVTPGIGIDATLSSNRQWFLTGFRRPSG
jgi:murein DD-endopeptidase MepM/ murein hydrolase activator NlpD